jgi:L-ascorbate metabolism protein UlaG (beta-lactamase superfamily)
VQHEDGTLSMARLEPGTASSEFFICIGDQPELDFGGRRNPDGQGFAAFGRVVEGMEVVRQIHEQSESRQMLEPPVAIVDVARDAPPVDVSSVECEGFDVPVEPGAPVVWYFSHSGVAVKTQRFLLFFDYIGPSAKDGLRTTGIVSASDLSGQDVVVFVSHAHPDHFDPTILGWADDATRIRYVVSSEVAEDPYFVEASATGINERALVVGPYEEHADTGGDLHLWTTRSTDAGVAFWVEADGVSIYHSGDLAIWGWNESGIEGQREIFLDEIEHFSRLDRRLDIAFVCADLRLPHPTGLTGAIDVLTELRPAVAVAIHNHGRHREASESLAERIAGTSIATSIAAVQYFGQCFRLDR